MEHVVFFPAHDGSPAFRRVATLEDAVRLVEHLRNVEGVNEVSCHALTEVPLAFRAWYRVEVPAGVDEAVAVVADVPAQPAAELEEPVSVPVAAEPAGPAEGVEGVEQPSVEPIMASANGHASDGAKSLGFFA